MGLVYNLAKHLARGKIKLRRYAQKAEYGIVQIRQKRGGSKPLPQFFHGIKDQMRQYVRLQYILH